MKKNISLVLIIIMIMAFIPCIGVQAADVAGNILSLGDDCTAVIKNDGSLWVWGWNNNGRLGDGTTEDIYTPVKIMDNVASVSLGGDHSAIIKADGSLWTFGKNWWGQIGNGTTEDIYTPVKIMNNVASVSLGYNHSAAIKEDGSLWMWGLNSSSQLGDGTAEDRHTPIKIMDNVVQVSLGNDHSAAIKEDGSLWVWGYNVYGQVGAGTTEDIYTPVKIMDNVKMVSLGNDHSAAIKEDGSLWMWGNNWKGQLGDGTYENEKLAPVKIMDNVAQVSLGYDHSAAIKEDGSLWMWGNNQFFRLGDGTEEDCCIPTKIMDNVKMVSLGNDHSAAIKDDGSLWMWGENYWGYVNDDLDSYIDSPVKIMDGIMLPNKTITPQEHINQNDNLCEGLAIDVSYKKISNNLGEVTVNITNNSNEIIVVNLDGGEGATIPAKTINDIVVEVNYPVAMWPTGENTRDSQINISVLKPKETYSWSHYVDVNNEFPGTYHIKATATAPGFIAASDTVTVIVDDNPVNMAKFDMAIKAKEIVDKMYSNADKKAEIDTEICEAREIIKNQITTTVSDKETVVPDDVYDAFAFAILEGLSGSEIDEYETNLNKLTKQIYKQLDKGMKSDTKTITINDCEYHVSYNVVSISGVGYGDQTVRWSESNGKRWSAILTWTNVATKEGNEALAKYCAALAQLNTDVWKEFTAYYISDTFGLVDIKTITKDNVENVLNITEKLILALDDKDKADELLQEIGNVAYEKLESGWINNKFQKYVKENVPNGDKIIEAAKKYKSAKDAFEKYAELFEKDTSSQKTQTAYEKYLKAYNALSSVLSEI